MLMGIPGVLASDLGTADMAEGTTVKASTEIIMDKGAVSFTDKSTGLSASTTTTINGVAFVPAKTTEGKELIWSTAEADPIVKMVYSYDGKTLKETITLKEDKVLTFPITLSTYSKLIPWDNGQWKIVATNSFETMKGIVLEKPYGIDANGKRIEMGYTYDKGVLTLVYDRTITEWIEEDKIVIDNKTGKETTERVWVPKYSQITYPLVIDPTWVAYSGHWIDNTTNATHTIEMWNATGTTSWTPPAGVTSVEYLVLAGGGGGGMGGVVGGGGGAGALLLNATGYAVNGSIAVVVGAGGAGGVTNGTTNIPAAETNRGRNGSVSSFSAISATGGGGGGSGGAAYINGVGGGSGGGATISGTVGSGTTGGNNGGAGFTGTAYGCGGGGGAGSAGVSGTSSAGGNGGTGVSSSITGTAVVYATGGGGAAVAAYTQGVGGSTNINHNSAVSGSAGESATANSGSGGGSSYGAGPYPNGGAGGSGIVIIKYLTGAVPPIPSFTSNVVSGYAPQAVQFNDTSVTTPTAWNWSYKNVTPGNNTQIWWSQVQNATNTFGVGNWDIRLNVTNASGSAITGSPYYVNVSPPMVLANFTCSPLGLTTSDTLSCVDTSTTGAATITNWSWTFEDSPTNQTATTQNAAITYTSDGVWDVTLGVYNATTGWNNRTRSNYVTVSASGGLSGFNRQDIMMDQIYTLILNVKDSVSLSGIPGATVATSNGDNLTTSVLGVATISTNYTALIVQVGASGYLSRTISYVVDRDRTETIYLTPIVVVPTAVPNTNILYTPKQVEVVIVSYDPAGVVVKNASVTLEAVANTLQADSQLETLYGINPIAANQLMNGTLVMHGLSDSSGGIVFTILQSINYKATVIDPRDGKTYIAMLYPGMDPYTIWIGTSPLAVNTTANTYLNTTKLFVTQPNVANITMNMQYQNKLGTTTSVVFTVKYQNNLTTAYQTTIAGFGTSMVYANYTVPNVRGQGYFYLYNATRTT